MTVALHQLTVYCVGKNAVRLDKYSSHQKFTLLQNTKQHADEMNNFR